MEVEGRRRRWQSKSASNFFFVVVFISFFFSAAASEAAAPASQEGIKASSDHSLQQEEDASSSSSSSSSSYHHVWPRMEFGWRIALGSMIGFFGAACGSVGGVGGGGIFVPMLTLIIGFDPKSSIALSKCMIMGTACSSVYYNIKLRHPNLDAPLIDYDLALLIQPMLMLGISIGVIFNVIFPQWTVTLLIIIILLGTSVKAFRKGIETWKRETILIKEAAKEIGSSSREIQYKVVSPSNDSDEQKEAEETAAISVVENVCWKEVGVLVLVWLAFLVLQVTKNYTKTCSAWYWVLNSLQIPVAGSAALYEAISLRGGKSMSFFCRSGGGDNDQEKQIECGSKSNPKLGVLQMLMYCSCGVIAGVGGGLLGLGGGFVLGPLFLELGLPPQVSSATSTFAMVFSSSISVVEYYLLNRFPITYAAFLCCVAAFAAFCGQYVVGRWVSITGRASLIIFILASMVFLSALSLGGVGASEMLKRIESHERMGFDDLCTYKP